MSYRPFGLRPAPLCLALFTAAFSAPAGEKLAPPGRIVSLAPNLTHLIAALGSGSSLVGITRFAPAAPSGAVQLVGDLLRWDAEKIIALRPDLVVGMEQGSVKRAVTHLRRLGLPVRTFRIESGEDLLAAIRTLGALLDRGGAAASMAAEISEAWEPRAGVVSKRALLLVSTLPLYASSPSSFEGDMLAKSGWTNALKDRSRRRLKLSPEEVLSLDPDAFFLASPNPAHAYRLPPALSSARAVREGRLFPVEADSLLQPGPLAGEAVRALRARLESEPR